MQRKLIKNARGQLLGFIDTDQQGRETAKNSRGQLLGSYDPKRDQTYDAKRELVNKGDALSSFITDDND